MKKIFLLLFSISLINSCSSGSEEPPPPPIKYTLTTAANPTAGGTVTPASGQHNEDATVSITAAPAGEYLFSSWSGATGTTATTSVVMNSNKTVTANFIKKKYALTTTVEGEGTVTEKVIKAGATTDYNSGTIVELTAVPSGEWLFMEWKGDVTGTENPTQITIDKAKSVTAVFVKKQYPLTIEIEGEGTVSEKVIKAGTPTDYNSGTIVELTAGSTEGWEFKEWTGDLESTENPAEITIDKAKSVTAVFVKAPVAYLDENGITVIANSWAEIGESETINQITYTVVDLETLREMIELDKNVTTVITSKITEMRNLFDGKPNFNQNIKTWDVSNVKDFTNMFIDSKDFNQDISMWNTSSAINLTGMFKNTKSFNQSLSNWNVQNVTNFTETFYGSETFNKQLTWDVKGATTMEGMFQNSIYDQDLPNWNVSNVTSFKSMFEGSKFNKDIGYWDTSSATTLERMFKSNWEFNQDIGSWNISNVTSLRYTFSDSQFSQDIGSWDTSKVTDFSATFMTNKSFSGDISEWDTSSAELMWYMFRNACSFNIDIGKWDVSNVKEFEYMFYKASQFNQDLNNWNTSSAENMKFMFGGQESNGSSYNCERGLTYFNGNISDWDVSNVTDMTGMFNDNYAFNQDLTNWCVTKIETEPESFYPKYTFEDKNKPIWGTCPSEPTIWNGSNITFTKADGANPEEEANQDRITDNIWITRGNDGGQIFNIKTETSYNKTDSPVGTKWAVGTLDQIETLTFKKFRAAVEKPNSSLVGKNLVMYLEEDDIYLSVKFTSWSGQKNGGFAYERSTKP